MKDGQQSKNSVNKNAQTMADLEINSYDLGDYPP
jgi:hypothetical protein